MDPSCWKREPTTGDAGRWGCRARLALRVLLIGALGCGTTRVTNTQRTATEQLLISNAVDQSVSQLDFRALANKPVYFDAQYLTAGIDQGYVVSSLRQQLLACGCMLTENRAQATYIIEARSGGVGTDQCQLLLGVPQMNLPSIAPGQPSAIPEIPLAKKTDQKGVAKILVFAYNRRTGRPVWQSGLVQSQSTSKDTWVLGAGPFRRGTLGEPTDIVGQQIRIPLLSGKENGTEDAAPVMAVTRPAVWEEAPDTEASPYRLTGEVNAAEAGKKAPNASSEPAKATAPATLSVESLLDGGSPPLNQLSAIRSAGPVDANRTNSAPGTGQPQAKDPDWHKTNSPASAGSGPAK